MLTFVGLGLSARGISVEGMEEARSADDVYAEFYTSIIPDFDLEEMESEIGNPIRLVERGDVEDSPEGILESAADGRAVLLVPGDPMIATTHVDLRLRAERRGIETRIVHGGSIQTAAAGIAGLQSYKFGKSATLPLPDKRSETPYDVLEGNGNRGLHTLFLLDIEAEEERYLTADKAVESLLDLEGELGRGVFSGEDLAVAIARAGSSGPVVKADRAGKLAGENFGPPPHALIVPGDLHFLEVEALKVFADAPDDVVEKYVKE